MFFQLSNVLGSPDQVLTQQRPAQVSEFLEVFWSTGRAAPRDLALGIDNAAAATLHRGMARANPLGGLLATPVAPVQWHHIVYAYLLENTRIVDIFRRVVHEWAHGERLPTASLASQRWLQVTEQVFFADAWPYSVRAVTSSIRPTAELVRRNAYYRLLGMDLNHASEGGAGYVKPDSANRDFAFVFEALLAEVWRGYTNRTTLTAQNLTDNNAILNLVRRLREMLLARRNSTSLSREEFDAVALLSWLHLGVRTNTTLVMDLNATANGVADRLKKVGERVGIPAHSRADAYFRMAEPLSRVLLAIEANASTNWPANLYGGVYVGDMLEIITQWSIATGRDVKDLGARPTSQAILAASGAALSGTSMVMGPRLLPTPSR